MRTHRLQDAYTLLERALVQERAAEMAAEVAQEAEHTGQKESAEMLWALVLRCRVHALKLRAQAQAQAGTGRLRR